ncbi:MAG TPA: hypothetical protein VG826_08390 [Pirellulales bacterium]|nr:hypothetical protein [Pirellulales bacterium]
MLGILSLVLLVVGAFLAGGGAFDWAFLFSDGYREYNWVRSVGRGGARGLLMLLGSVVILVGFVGQVVDAAAKPVFVTANSEAALDKTDGLPPAGGSADGSHSTETGKAGPPATVPGPAVSGPSHHKTSPAKTSPAVPQSQAATRSPGSSGGPPPAPPGGYQPITIWNPEVELYDGEATISLEYRFEAGHEPVPGAEYVWRLELPDGSREVVYESLQSEGRLQYLAQLSQAETGLTRWSTVLSVDLDGKQKRVSNRLEIASGKVRSVPLEAPR